MTFEQIVYTIKQCVYEITDIEIDELAEDASLMGDLDISSMEILQVISAIEEEFSIKISEKDLRTFISICDIANYVSIKLYGW